MPIYGYACTHCGHTLDALQKIADDPLVDCPECEQPNLKRQLSAPRFRLKGSGWYETDFKSDNKRNLAGDPKPAEANGASGGDKKTGDATSGADAKKADTKKAEPKKADTKAASSTKSSESAS